MLLLKFWQFFFTAYYVQISWGEKKHPHENAFNLMAIMYFVNTISVINTIRFFVSDKYNDRLHLLIIVGIVVIIIIRGLVFNKKSGFKKRIHSFTNLSLKEAQKRNIINLVFSLIFTMIFQGVSWYALYHWNSPLS